MNQSGFLAACLLGGFVLFLASKNRLQTYADIFWTSPTASSGSSGSSGGSIFGAVGTALEIASVAAAAS